MVLAGTTFLVPGVLPRLPPSSQSGSLQHLHTQPARASQPRLATNAQGAVAGAAAVVACTFTSRRLHWRAKARGSVKMRAESESEMSLDALPKTQSVVEKAAKGPRWAPGAGAIVEKKQPAPYIGSLKAIAIEDMQEVEVFKGDGRVFRCIYENGIGIRVDSRLNCRRTGQDIVQGECFEIGMEVRRGDRSFYQLIDGRGWVFDWVEIDGERVQLTEMAAQLYTVGFQLGVAGLLWKSDTTMRFAAVSGFASEGAAAAMAGLGIRTGDILLAINEEPVLNLPFPQVLERLWATSGKQPGGGDYYKVVTTNKYGIGIRSVPDFNGPRTGQDLMPGTIFEVDEIIEEEEGYTYLHLVDNRGWVFDTRPVDPENPSVLPLSELPVGAVLTFWRGSVAELGQTMGIDLTQDALAGGKPVTITVLEEGSPITKIRSQPGVNLRSALVDNGFEIYQSHRAVFNCKAQSLCGTCVVDIVKGLDNLTVQSLNEKRVMAANPLSYRLACGMDVFGDITVRIRPEDAQYGGGTM